MTRLYTTYTPCSHESELLTDFRALNMVNIHVLIAEMRITMLSHSVNVAYLARAGHFVKLFTSTLQYSIAVSCRLLVLRKQAFKTKKQRKNKI